MTLNTLLDLGIMIFAGMFMGRMGKHIKLPNVTGYLIAGLLIGPYFFRSFGLNFSILSEDFINSITIISEAALGFIAFSIGDEFKISYFKRVGATPIIIAAMESLIAVVLVDIGLVVAGNSVPFSMVLGAIAAATAPAATIMVVNQYRAKGPVTETLLSVVALDDATALIFFSLSIAIAKSIVNPNNGNLAMAILNPIIQIAGALAIGAVLGFIFMIPLRYFHKKGNRISLICGFVFAGIGIADMLGISSLLLCMAMGAIIANFCQDADSIMDLCSYVTPPIFMLFFVVSGAGLQISVLQHVGVIGAIYVILRVVGKSLGAALGSIICKAPDTVKKYLGPCLLPQAGVAIGLTLVAGRVVPEYAEEIRAVILAGTLIYELIGPTVTKISLTKAGEIKE